MRLQDSLKFFTLWLKTNFKLDNGTKFFNECLEHFFQEKGNVHQSNCRDTPQQNEIAEHKNRHLLEEVMALMFHANVSC